MSWTESHPLTPTTSHQIPLPLSPPEPAPLLLDAELATLHLDQVWPTLALATKTQVRLTLLHILQEVLHEHHGS
jgi:hypothetical protein